MTKSGALVFGLIISSVLSARQRPFPRTDQFLDASAAISSSEETAAFQYVRNWALGKKENWRLGWVRGHQCIPDFFSDKMFSMLPIFLPIRYQFSLGPYCVLFKNIIPFLGKSDQLSHP
jgi:hypothetical protein